MDRVFLITLSNVAFHKLQILQHCCYLTPNEIYHRGYSFSSFFFFFEDIFMFLTDALQTLQKDGAKI